MNKYNHLEIEAKWQKEWGEKELYKTREDSEREKFYVLDMFPYPSGAGLHVGHPKGYIATDVFSRMKTMQGYNVLHPMGWDAFGLPAENFALKNKIHPRVSTDKNVETFKSQLAKLGFSYDWDREINTTDPAFYKWTQWAFVKMFERGLAYESHEPINWCPSCKTGLANEDLEAGKCERCGSDVEQKPMRQWVLKITDYADRMLEDLEKLPDWDASIKEMQRNWIGRSEGAKVTFQIESGSDSTGSHRSPDSLQDDGSPKGTILLVHGVGGSSQENWFPWLKKEYEARGYKVLIPDLPNSDMPVLEEWLEALRELKAEFEGSLTVIGHSLGCPAACVFVDQEKLELEKLILVAPASEHSKSEEELIGFGFPKEQIELMRKFKKAKLSFSDINKLAKKIVQLYSKDDPFISLDAQEDYKELESEIKIFEDKGHFSAGRGDVTQFPEINEFVEGESFEGTGSLDSTRDDNLIEIFTTRPDTLFGATYFVVAPEHSLIKNYKLKIKNYSEVEAYVEKAKNKTDLERTDLNKDKTGVRLEGVYAVNPANGERLPIFVADYVLIGYGTGVIMAVPAHDERDYEFAKKFDLPIKEVVARETGEPGENENEKRGGCAIVFDPESQKYAVHKRPDGMFAFYSGGANEGETLHEAVQRELREESGFHEFELVEEVAHSYTHYYNSVKKHRVCGWALCNLVVLKSTERKDLKLEEHEEEFEQCFVSADEILENWEVQGYTDGSLDHWINFLHSAVARAIELGYDKTSDKEKYKHEVYTGKGPLVNSGEFSGMSSEEAKTKITEFVAGEKAVNYKLKDWVFSRQRYWGEPIPVIHCEKCGAVAVPEEDLPVELPEVEHYEPSGTGESPLVNIEDWVNTTCPKCGGEGKRETNTMPQWAGSSWYYLRFIDPHNDKALIDKDRDKYWSPVDFYVGGAEHATRHLIYARFWHKVLFDIGAVSHDEPFTRLQHVGLIMAEDGRKMSKRWGNVINPDQIVEEHGADAMRVYEMFMGPFSQAVSWSTTGLKGARKFLERVYALQLKIKNEKVKNNRETLSLLHKTIKKVGEDIEAFKLNTAVSAMMILVNQFEKDVKAGGEIAQENWEMFLKILSPYAPHLAEELWSKLGNEQSIFFESWPEYDAELAKDEMIELVLQVNGKVRDRIEVEADIEKDKAIEIAKASEIISKWLEGKEIVKEIYVPGKIVNIVVK